MQVFGVVLLVLSCSLATSFNLSIRTVTRLGADSDGPFTGTLVGESRSHSFNIDPIMYTPGAGIRSQTLVADMDRGELYEIILKAGTLNAWIIDGVWLDGTILTLPAEEFVFEKEGDGACNVRSHEPNADGKSWSCGNTLRLYLQKGYLDGHTFAFGLNKPDFCGHTYTDGPVNATLHGTTGTLSFYLEDHMYSQTGASEMTIMADIGSVYAVTLETKTEDAMVFDKVWLNHVEFMLPAEEMILENEGGYCNVRDHSCVPYFDSLTCVTSVTLYLDYEWPPAPTLRPTENPSYEPTLVPTTLKPTREPTRAPSAEPTPPPSSALPTLSPTEHPSSKPTLSPTLNPTVVEDADDSSESNSGVLHILGHEGSTMNITLALWLASIICFCCACMILCASVLWARKNKSRTTAVMLQMQELRQIMMRDGTREAPDNKMMDLHQHDSLFSQEGQTHEGQTSPEKFLSQTDM